MTTLDYRSPYTATWTIGVSPQNNLPVVIDLDALNPPTGELVPYHPPVPTITLPLPRDTVQERFWEYCIDGHGIIHGLSGAVVVVAGVTVWSVTLSMVAAVNMVIAAAPIIGAVLTAIVLGTIICRRGTKGDDVLVLKGCNNGPTPGSHSVKLCNGRH